MSATRSVSHIFPRHFGIALWLIGVTAALSLLLAPLELLMPPELKLPALAFRALALINPLLLISAGVALGCWMVPKVGMDAPLLRALIERRPAGAIARSQLPPAIAAAAVSALIILVYGAFTAPWFEGTPAAALNLPLATKLLYGGVVEELLMRWGAMALLTWLAWKAIAPRAETPAVAYVIGAIAAALLFAAGHLPTLYALVPSPAAGLVGAVIAANFVPGLLFGLLFWKRGLEAACMAHALTHLFATLVGGLAA